jgi:prophage regulatory protein
MIEDRYIRMRELAEMLSISDSTIYRLIQENKFPKQIKLTVRTSVWKLSEINKWIEDKESEN